MTWVRITDGPPVQVQAYKVNRPAELGGERVPQVQLTLGTQTAFLSEEDAASLGGYLMGVTNNPPPQAPVPPLVVSPEGGALMRGEEPPPEPELEAGKVAPPAINWTGPSSENGA